MFEWVYYTGLNILNCSLSKKLENHVMAVTVANKANDRSLHVDVV